VKCNRCNKVKTKHDFNGKPKHLLRKSNTLSTNAAQNEVQSINYESNGNEPNLGVLELSKTKSIDFINSSITENEGALPQL